VLFGWSSLLSTGLLVASIAVLIAAALHDIIARTVPNWMAATLALLGVAAVSLNGRPLVSVSSALFVFLLGILCWARGWLGGGDVKLLSAAMLVVPPGRAASFICAVALTGAVLALLYIAARRVIAAPGSRRPTRLLARAIRAERWRIRRSGPLPYALAIAAGFLITTL